MTPASLRDWMTRLNINKSQAASALGIARTTLDGYLAGRYPIPILVGLACVAVEAGLVEPS